MKETISHRWSSGLYINRETHLYTQNNHFSLDKLMISACILNNKLLKSFLL